MVKETEGVQTFLRYHFKTAQWQFTYCHSTTRLSLAEHTSRRKHSPIPNFLQYEIHLLSLPPIKVSQGGRVDFVKEILNPSLPQPQVHFLIWMVIPVMQNTDVWMKYECLLPCYPYYHFMDKDYVLPRTICVLGRTLCLFLKFWWRRMCCCSKQFSSIMFVMKTCLLSIRTVLSLPCCVFYHCLSPKGEG